jgi:hypothetical protein
MVAPKLVRPQSTRKGRVTDSQAILRQDLGYVWAPSCTGERQTVAFVRDVVLPGPPGDVSFGIDQLSYGGVVEKAVLFVNGRQAFSVGSGSARVERDKTHVGLFTYGRNQLKVEVTKRADSRKRCNTGAAASDFGVQFQVFGAFVADVAVRTDLPATDAMRSGFLQPVNGTVEIFNNGPSGVYSGQFRFIISGTVKDLVFKGGPDVDGPGVTGCKSTVPAGSLVAGKVVEITCKLRNMPPRTKAVVRFQLAVSIGSATDYAAIRYAREVFSSADDPKNNNTLTNTILLCVEGNQNPACASAK